MAIDMSVLLQSAHMAFENNQLEQSLFLIKYAQKLASEYKILRGLSPLDVAICLDRGRIRQQNEDCVLAIHGIQPETGKAFGLFTICDGMGGHAHGQEAACTASQTIVDTIFPLLIHGHAPRHGWRSVLIKSIEQANRAIYRRNQRQKKPGIRMLAAIKGDAVDQASIMGTTVTAVLLLDTTAYVANVGDSRTYLHTQATGLTRITRDHSVVATLLTERAITEEEAYNHPRRNQITRCLGHDASIEVDSFIINLPEYAILLLCSDGLWAMTRDQQMAATLQYNRASAKHIAHQLLSLAAAGGARDNIGFVVVRFDRRMRRNNISNQKMMWHHAISV